MLKRFQFLHHFFLYVDVLGRNIFALFQRREGIECFSAVKKSIKIRTVTRESNGTIALDKLAQKGKLNI